VYVASARPTCLSEGWIVTADFSGVDAKLVRGDYHLETLKHEIQQWTASRPYLFSYEQDPSAPENTTWIESLSLERPLPALEWGVLVGEIVHAWRSALDHAVYALAVQNTGQDPPPYERSLQFPICDRRDGSWGWENKRRQLRGVHQDAIFAIERSQPYNRPGPFGMILLAFLRDLDDADKHRILTVVASALAGSDYTPMIRQILNGVPVTIIHREPGDVLSEKKTEVARYVYDFPQPQGRVSSHRAFVIATEMPAGMPWKYASVDWALDFIREEVGNRIDYLRTFADLPPDGQRTT